MTDGSEDEPPGPGWWTRTSSGEWVKFEPDEDDAGADPGPSDALHGDVEVAVVLSDDERQMLRFGLIDWDGPAHPTHSMAVAAGYSGLDELERETVRIESRLRAQQPLTTRDWSRTLLLTELVFASSLLGSGPQWTAIQAGTDERWLRVLRGLQAKLPTSREFLGP